MTKFTLALNVERWCAWLPTPCGASTCTGFSNGQPFSYQSDVPDVSSVPAMQRRRLGKMARVAFHVLSRCAESGMNEPLIFSSMMGEIRRTQTILESIASENAVSPTSFSLSVHNAIGGLWSLINGIQAPVIALAPHGCSPIPGILEATGLLQEGRFTSVNIVYCEENYPEFYFPYFDSPPSPLALGVRLTSPDFSDHRACQLGLRQIKTRGSTVTWKSLLEFVELLSGERSALELSELGPCWELALKT